MASPVSISIDLARARSLHDHEYIEYVNKIIYIVQIIVLTVHTCTMCNSIDSCMHDFMIVYNEYMA